MTDLAEHHDALRTIARDLLPAASPEAIWRQATDAGWMGLEVPEADGGAGAGFAEVAIVLEELGRAASPLPYLGTAVLGVGALLAAAPSATVHELLARVAAGGLPVAVALTASADAREARPPFRLDATSGTAVLRGRAELVVDAPGARHLLLLVADGAAGGRPALVVADPADLVVQDVPVLDRTRRFGTVVADEVEVEPEQLLSLGADPSGTARRLLDRFAVAVSCDALGLAAAMLDATVAHVVQRHQFGRPIGSFQAVKHLCADAHVRLEIGRELVGAAVDALVAGAAGAPAAASRAKAYVGQAAVDIVGTALQLHGGIGYTWESGIHEYFHRAVLDRSLAGAPIAHRRALAQQLWGTSPHRTG